MDVFGRLLFIVSMNGSVPYIQGRRCGLMRPGLCCGVLLMLCLGMLCMGCSTRKNTAASRNYNAFITRYNIYYNGDTHFQETLRSMEDNYEDDYSRQLFMHPVEAKADEQAPQPSGNFDRSIEKGQKAIQLRSIKKRPRRKPGKSGDAAYQAWMKRDEYNPFLHNAWMMMGRSQYFNGDFLGAASTFFYVSRQSTYSPFLVASLHCHRGKTVAGPQLCGHGLAVRC